MQVEVLRGTEKFEAKVIVRERPDDPNRFLDAVKDNSSLVPALGILATDITEPLLKLIPELREPAGALVAALVEGQPDSEDGLAPGDLIISLNGKPVPNVRALQDLLGELQTGSPVVLRIQRQDQLRYIVLELP